MRTLSFRSRGSHSQKTTTDSSVGGDSDDNCGGGGSATTSTAATTNFQESPSVDTSTDSPSYGIPLPSDLFLPASPSGGAIPSPRRSLQQDKERPIDDDMKRLVFLAKHPTSPENGTPEMRIKKSRSSGSNSNGRRRTSHQKTSVNFAAEGPVDADTGEAWIANDGSRLMVNMAQHDPASFNAAIRSPQSPIDTDSCGAWTDDDDPDDIHNNSKGFSWMQRWMNDPEPQEDGSLSKQSISVSSEKTPKISNVTYTKDVEEGSVSSEPPEQPSCLKRMKRRSGLIILILSLVLLLAVIVTAVAAVTSAKKKDDNSAVKSQEPGEMFPPTPFVTRGPTPPTKAPTAIPTSQPSPIPTPQYSPQPSVPTSPTKIPITASPTIKVPTPEPSSIPTQTPTRTQIPSASPTINPTGTTPTVSPSARPTSTPSYSPTKMPTLSPSSSPTLSPSVAPSSVPTPIPTNVPSVSPTTQAPTTSFLNNDFVEVAEPVSGTQNGGRFGFSVAISQDGTVMAVGAPFATIEGREDAGLVQVFELRTSDGAEEWVTRGPAIVGRNAGDQFGSSISLSRDGSVLVASEPTFDGDAGDRSGNVRAFVLSPLYRYEPMGQDLEGYVATDHFGIAIALSGDGRRLAIGAPYYDNSSGGIRNVSGQVRVFEFDGNRWSQLGQPLAGSSNTDWFGWSVDISDDGSVVAAGAPRNLRFGGYVRCYLLVEEDEDEDGSPLHTWVPYGTDIRNTIEPDRFDDSFGHAVSLSGNNLLAIGAPGKDFGTIDSGFVVVYSFDGDWERVGDAIVAGGEETTGYQLGFSVDIRDQILAIGVPGYENQGQVLLFELSGNNQWVPHPTVLFGQEGDLLGFSVRLSADANHIAIGSTSGLGKAEVYRVI